MGLINLLNKEIKIFSKIVILISLIVVFTTTDLIIKEVVTKNLKDNKNITVINKFWYFTYTENDDLGLSILKGITKNFNKRVKFLLMVGLQGSACLLAIIIYFYLGKIKYLIPISLIICGGLGNLIDRIIRGFVVDYIMWFFQFIPSSFFNPFPIFNLADTYTSVGAFLLFIVVFFFSNEEKKNNEINRI